MFDSTTAEDTGQSMLDQSSDELGYDASEFDASEHDIDGLNSLRGSESDGSGDAATATAPGSSAGTESWATTGHRLLAQRLGLADADLQTFAGAAEFERAAAIIDRQQREWLGQIQQSRHAPQAPAKSADAPTSDQPPTTQQQLAAWLKEGNTLNVDYYRNGDGEFVAFDAPTMAIVEKVAEAEARMQELVAWKSQFEAQQKEQQELMLQEQLHDAFDALDPEYFGRSLVDGRPAEITDEQLKRRDMMREAAQKVMPLIEKEIEILGGSPPSLAEILERVYRRQAPQAAPQARAAQPAVPQRPVAPPASAPTLDKNGEELRGAALESRMQSIQKQQSLGDRQEALRKQSAMRRPAGSHRGVATPGKPVDPHDSAVQRVLRDPDVQDSLARMRKAFGG